MKKCRISYLIIVFVVIAVGICSRKIDFIPLFIGDLLYAVMMYFGIRFLFIAISNLKSAIIALTICFCIEILQLYDGEWFIHIRNTTFGHLIFGQGFLWSDLLAYFLGIFLAYHLEPILIKLVPLRN